MELDNIKQKTTWNDASNTINLNFAKLKQVIQSLDGSSSDIVALIGELQSKDAELTENLTETSLLAETNKSNIDSLQQEVNVLKNSYIHTQNEASTIWTIIHDMGKYPSATVVDSAGTVVYGEIVYINTNQIEILFSAPFSGKAYLN